MILIQSRWIPILLALVIAMQSAFAIGDTNLPHNAATHHYAHVGSVAHDNVMVHAAASDTERANSPFDAVLSYLSDHGHQNHIHLHVVLVESLISIVVPVGRQSLSNEQSYPSSVVHPSLFRPPIA
mgnify:FL=1|tara:strand:- start:156 stop:533 length:378 start_codon:yes stop_codon:yes gene_type:complete